MMTDHFGYSASAIIQHGLFMRFASILLASGLVTSFGCNQATNPQPASVTAQKDTKTAEADSTLYSELLDTSLQYDDYITALTGVAVQKLIHHKGEGYFDTPAIFKGYTGHLRFHQGHLFTKQRTNGLVEISDDPGNRIFLVFTYGGGWQLKQVFEVNGFFSDSSSHFYDYNFDGYDDFAVFWEYSAGRCSCESPGCRNLYLYDKTNDTLVKVRAVSDYLDFGIFKPDKAIYLGEHCDGFYRKFHWRGYKLQVQEEYIFEERESQTPGVDWKLKHNRYQDGKLLTSSRHPNRQLPADWKKVFGWRGNR